MEASKVLKRLSSIRPLPSTSLRALELVEEPEPDLDTLLDLIKGDAAISFRILSHVNSAFYALPYQVTDLRRAVIFIGIEEVRNLVLKVAISEGILETIGTESSYVYNVIYNHAIATATLSEAISHHISIPSKTEAFLAGLFHDIGKMALFTRFPEEYKRAYETARDGENSSLLKSEKDVFGLDHVEAGLFVMEMWKMPSIYTDIVRYHHKDYKTITEANLNFDPAILFAVMIADTVANQVFSYMPGQVLPKDILRKLMVKIGLSTESLQKALSDMQIGIDKYSHVLSMAPDSENMYITSLKSTKQFLTRLITKKIDPEENGWLIDPKEGMENILLLVLNVISLGLISKGRQLVFSVFLFDRAKSSLSLVSYSPTEGITYSFNKLGNEFAVKLNLEKNILALLESYIKRILSSEINRDITYEKSGYFLCVTQFRENFGKHLGVIVKLDPVNQQVKTYLSRLLTHGRECLELLDTLGHKLGVR